MINKGRQKWSVLSCFWAALAGVVLSAIAVTLLMDKPVWLELETLAALMGVFMTIAYTCLLYSGVQFIRDETITFGSPLGEPLDFPEHHDSYVEFGTFTRFFSAEEPALFLLGLILDILICVVTAVGIGFAIWLGVNIIFVSMLAMVIPFFYIFQRSLLFVMAHAEECYRNLYKSFMYGLVYAGCKTVILCAIIYFAHVLVEHFAKIS